MNTQLGPMRVQKLYILYYVFVITFQSVRMYMTHSYTHIQRRGQISNYPYPIFPKTPKGQMDIKFAW